MNPKYCRGSIYVKLSYSAFIWRLANAAKNRRLDLPTLPHFLRIYQNLKIVTAVVSPLQTREIGRDSALPQPNQTRRGHPFHRQAAKGTLSRRHLPKIPFFLTCNSYQPNLFPKFQKESQISTPACEPGPAKTPGVGGGKCCKSLHFVAFPHALLLNCSTALLSPAQRVGGINVPLCSNLFHFYCSPVQLLYCSPAQPGGGVSVTFCNIS
jgi:hypothetical protein